MFNPTKAHKKEISNGQYRLRMGGRVPQGAVNLAYSYITPLTPTENITIADSSSFVLENVAAGREVNYKLWPNEAHLLYDESGIADIYSQIFMLTDVFENDVPLYYVHRLRFYHYDSIGPDEHGLYQGTTITVVDKNGNKVSGDKVYQVKLIPSGISKLYYVDIFSNFQTKPGEEYKVIYNAIEIMTNGERSIMTNHSERFNAKVSFMRVKEMIDVLHPANRNQPYYYQMDSADFGYTKVSVPRKPIKDTRIPELFRYIIKVTVDLGSKEEVIHSPWIDASVYNTESLIANDAPYFNGFTHVSSMTAEQQVAHYLGNDSRVEWLETYPCIYSVISNNTDVEVDVKADGKEPVLASTEKDTGRATPPLNYKTYKKIPVIQFQTKIMFRNIHTDEWHTGLITTNNVLPDTEGETDIRLLSLSQLSYPANYSPENWELLLEPADEKIPVTLSFYNQTLNTRQYPLPCTELDPAIQIAIRAETHYAQQMFAPTYALRPSDNMQITALKPLATGVNENWFLRIQNGRFQRDYVDNDNLPKGYGYFIPEYYTQGFAEEYGMPYRLVERERPQVIGERLLKLRYTPLFITTDPVTNLPNNIVVTVNNVELGIHAWDSTSGILEMIGAVRETDNIEVKYFYQETAYEYRGYYNATENKFVYLDLNPGPGHYSTQWDTESGSLGDLPSYSLINKTVYLYLRPAGETTNIMDMQAEQVKLDALGRYELAYPALRHFIPRVYTRLGNIDIPHIDEAPDGSTSWEYIDEGYVSNAIKINNPSISDSDGYLVDYSYVGHKYQFANGDFQRNVLFHEFFEITEPNTILLARIQVRPNSTYENIDIIDTRTRGGGLLEDIGRNIMQEIAPESASYWDIGYWDGEPYQENSVLVIKLPRHILKKFGGKLTQEEVEEAVKKYMALGTFYIIEFEEDPLALLEVPSDLVAEAVELEDIKPTPLPIPVFKLTVEG